jgi:uncharacterized FlaG/YvyC family protein
MQISPISGSSGSGAAGAGPSNTAISENLRNAVAAASRLNSLSIEDREFAVVRDPGSNRFVVVVRDKSTGTVLDQFPPEEILKMLSQLSSTVAKQNGDTTE